MIKYFSYFFILLYPYIVNLNLQVGSLNLDEIFLAILFVLTISYYVIKSSFKKILQVEVITIRYFLIILLTIATQIGLNLTGFGLDIMLFMSVGKLFLFYIVYKILIDEQIICSKNVINIILFSSIPIHIVGVFQYINPDLINSIIEPYFEVRSSIHNYSICSILGDKNSYGGYSLFISLLAIMKYNNFKNYINLTFFLFQVVGLFLSGSSSSFIGFIIIIYLHFFKGMSTYAVIKRVLIMFAFLLLFLIIFNDIIISQIERQMRSDFYSRAMESHFKTYGLPSSLLERAFLFFYLGIILIQNPINNFLGFGFSDKAILLLPWGTVETGYMSMWFHTGLISIFLYFSFWVYVLKKVKVRNDFSGQLVYTTIIVQIIVNFIFIYYKSYTSGFLLNIYLAMLNDKNCTFTEKK